MSKLKIVLIVILSMFIISIYLGYKIIYSQIYIKNIYKFENALNSYNIDDLDNILSYDAEICYKKNSKSYKECRENIYRHMQNKDFNLTIYGGSDNVFKNNVLQIDTQFYGKVKGKNFGENSLTVYLRREGLYSFQIIKLESNDDILAELFLW